MWPLPPIGPLFFVCEWPAAGIPLTRVEVDRSDSAMPPGAPVSCSPIRPARSGAAPGHGGSEARERAIRRTGIHSSQRRPYEASAFTNIRESRRGPVRGDCFRPIFGREHELGRRLAHRANRRAARCIDSSHSVPICDGDRRGLGRDGAS